MQNFNMGARNSISWILQYRPAEIILTLKRCVVHQIIITSMWPFLRIIVKEVLTRSCVANSIKIWIKYCPHLMTGFYGHSMLREWPV